MAATDRPVFTSAVGELGWQLITIPLRNVPGSVGYPPLDDVGGVYGWQDIKAVFAAQNPTPAQLHRRQWVIGRMDCGTGSDPLAVGNGPYSPLNDVNLNTMNDQSRWERHLEKCRADSEDNDSYYY
jgi:hypothetical protein